MPAKIYSDKDADLSVLKGKTCAVLGFGSQGHAHALNLKESGLNVIIGLYEGSKSIAAAEEKGFKVYPTAEAVRRADVIFVAHAGLDTILSIGDVWRRFPVDQVIRARWWRVPFDQVPRGADHETQDPRPRRLDREGGRDGGGCGGGDGIGSHGALLCGYDRIAA